MRILNKKYWPYRVQVTTNPSDNFETMREWVKERATKPTDWNVVGKSGNSLDFYFVDEGVATMFTLRWAQCIKAY